LRRYREAAKLLFGVALLIWIAVYSLRSWFG
jgi:hypothetical protein